MIIQSTDTGVLIDVTETGEVGGIIHGFPYLRLSRTSDFPRVTLLVMSELCLHRELYNAHTRLLLAHCKNKFIILTKKIFHYALLISSN